MASFAEWSPRRRWATASSLVIWVRSWDFREGLRTDLLLTFVEAGTEQAADLAGGDDAYFTALVRRVREAVGALDGLPAAVPLPKTGSFGWANIEIESAGAMAIVSAMSQPACKIAPQRARVDEGGGDSHCSRLRADVRCEAGVTSGCEASRLHRDEHRLLFGQPPSRDVVSRAVSS